MKPAVAVFAVLACIGAAPAHGQVLVEAVAPAWASAQTGIAAGDRLLSWERTAGPGAPTHGAFRDPWDVREFEVEQLPRGPTRVRLVRSGSPLSLTIRSSDWGVRTAVWLDDPARRDQLQRGIDRAHARDIEGALAAWRPLLETLTRARQWRAAAWLNCRIGTMLVEPVGGGKGRWALEWVNGKGVKKGLRKDEALRQAQLAFIRGDGVDPSWTAPAYWAAFGLSGDWRPIGAR